MDQTRSAACITTADLDAPGPTIVYVNPAYCEMTGRSEDEVVGSSPRIMQGPLTSRPVLDRLRADLAAGRPFMGEAVNYRKDGKPFLISWRIDPVVDDRGRTTHFIATQSDITAFRRAERLLDAGRAIDRSVSTLLSQPADARTNVGALASDIATAITSMIDYGSIGIAGSIRLGTSSTPFEAGDIDPDHGHLFELAEDGDGSVHTGSIGDRFWLGCSLGNARGGIDGAVVVSDLTADELEFVDHQGLERAAVSARRALDSLAEYERQRLAAVELQRDLLPDEPPAVPGLELAVHYQPGAFASRVGGDWYDVIVDDRGTAVLVVGDMAGSGLRAAADMGRVRLLMRVLIQQGRPVGEVFALLNQFCAEEDLLATAVAVTIDPVRGETSVISAGHLPPVVRRGDRVDTVPVTARPLLGIGGSAVYESEPLALDVGESVILYTDGLIERPDERIDDSLRALVDAVAGHRGTLADLGEHLVSSGGGDGAKSDDIALLAVRRVTIRE
ncbi:MAG: SpoIIE family protein phosphatase [Actinomycetota bacterium]